MTHVNPVLNTAFDFVLSPFAAGSPWPGMLCISFLSSLLLLLIFKFASNQKAVKKKKARVLAHVMELLIFRDDPVLTIKALWAVLVANLAYLVRLIVPLTVAMVPLTVILTQLSAWHSSRPLHAGETTVVTARLSDGLPVMEQSVSLVTSDGIVVDPIPVRAPSVNEISWRVRVTHGANEWVDVQVNGASYRKLVSVGRRSGRTCETRMRAGFWGQVTCPSEAPLPADGEVSVIRMHYPDSRFELGSGSYHWLLVFFVLTLFFGLALMKPLRVQI